VTKWENEYRPTSNGLEDTESKTLNFNRIGKSTGEICLAFRLRARMRTHHAARRPDAKRTDRVWDASGVEALEVGRQPRQPRLRRAGRTTDRDHLVSALHEPPSEVEADGACS